MRISDWSSDVCSSDLDRVPSPLKVFLLGLAIADDIGAIIVIAIFYTEDLAFDWLGAAALGLVVVTVMRRAKVWYAPLYVVVGVVVWYCTLKSGIHATIAGVRSEEHTSELQSLMRISYAVFCLKKKNTQKNPTITIIC